jgi:septal ring factor EnvC (AmiA/AmiB activator)
MDSIDVKSIIAILTFLAGAGSAVLGMLRWFSTSERKRFAAEREFEHLKRNQEQMKQSSASLAKEIDNLSDDMKTLTAVFNVMLSQQGQSVSGLLGYKKPD